MEITGYLKVIIVCFAVAIPVTVVFLVYRIVFAGLNSIPASRRAVNADEETANPESALDSKSTEIEVGKLKPDTDMQ